LIVKHHTFSKNSYLAQLKGGDFKKYRMAEAKSPRLFKREGKEKVLRTI